MGTRSALLRTRPVANVAPSAPSALQLFGLAAQHFLLPALTGNPALLARLLGQFLLAARQFIELLERLVDLLVVLAGGARRLLGLVLILLRVQFEIEQALRGRAPSLPPPPPPPPLPKATSIWRNVASARSRDLQGLLLLGKGVLPFLLLQALAAGSMASAAAFISFSKLLNSSFSSVSSRLCRRPAREIAWSRSLACTPERNLAASAGPAAWRSCRLMLPGLGDDFLSRWEMSFWSFRPSAASATARHCWDCENSRSNGSAWMKDMSVRDSECASLAMA